MSLKSDLEAQLGAQRQRIHDARVSGDVVQANKLQRAYDATFTDGTEEERATLAWLGAGIASRIKAYQPEKRRARLAVWTARRLSGQWTMDG